MSQCACASKVYIIIDFFKQYTMYKSNRPKDKRGGGIQFSGYHPLKEVKFVGGEATGRH